jgi:hypothetical protein
MPMSLSGHFVLREFEADGAWRLLMPEGEWQRLERRAVPASGFAQAKRVQLVGGPTVRTALFEHGGHPWLVVGSTSFRLSDDDCSVQIGGCWPVRTVSVLQKGVVVFAARYWHLPWEEWDDWDLFLQAAKLADPERREQFIRYWRQEREAAPSL